MKVTDEGWEMAMDRDSPASSFASPDERFSQRTKLVVGMAALFALSSLSPAACTVVRVAHDQYDRHFPTPPPACR